MDFVGRERELALLGERLERVRADKRGAFIAMRGRRRVGKSRLAEEFARRSGSPYVYYTATQQGGATELDRFVESIEASDVPRAADVREGLRPQSWEAALALATDGASADRPPIVVLDEFPYLEQREPGIEATLQKVWDRTWQSQPVLIVLIGSDEAMMEALTEQGRPLYDRLREMAIQPLTPADVGGLLQLEPADALDAYLVIGGFPVLATEWGAGRTLEQYLAEALADPTSFLVVSGERALSAEFPAPAARAVLAAIGIGARAHTAILNRTGLSGTTVNETLESLRRRRVVRRLTPYSARATVKTPLWEVTDPYTRFWLAFVDGRIDLIERGRGGLLLEAFERDWPAYRGRAIEHVVRDSLEFLLPDESRFGAARYVGGYWNRTGTIEVDLVGGDARPVAKRIGFVGSIKWRLQRPFSREDGIALVNRRDDVPGAGEKTLLVGVSSTGFDDDAPLDVRIDPVDLLEAWRLP